MDEKASQSLNGPDVKGVASSTMLSIMKQQRAPSKSRRRLGQKDKRSSRFGIIRFLRFYRDVSYQNTWLNPLIVLLLVGAGYAIKPTVDNPLRAAIFLSYPLPPDPTSPCPNATQYGKGVNDIYFGLFYTCFFSFTREFLMQCILRPLAIYYKIPSKAKIERFMEQAYTAIYFAIFSPYGLYVMYHTETWYFRNSGYYERYPHRTHTADFKAYYLLQAAYWSQQAIVLLLQLEKPRKDFKELVLHHIVTLTLVIASYKYHFTYVGLGVFVTHDISDFFLATSKTLNYIDHPLIGPYFGLFILVWIYMRHYINLGIIAGLFNEFKNVGPWHMDWEGGSYKSSFAQTVAVTLLGSLQAVNLFWLWLILKIAKRFVMSGGTEAVDERSENEEEESIPPVDDVGQAHNDEVKKDL